MRRALVWAALLCFAPLTLAHAGDGRSCSQVGAEQRPTLRPGSYEVAKESGVTHIWFTDAATHARTQLGDGEWPRTTGITAFKGWLYVVAGGHLLKANPETGEWFPKPRSGKGRCAFYDGWLGPIWVQGGALYAVKGSRDDPDERRIARIDFEAAKDEIVSTFRVTRVDVK